MRNTKVAYSRSKEVCRFDPSISIDFEFINTILWSYFD